MELLGVYGTPYRGEEEHFWNTLGEVISEWQNPWLIAGDLNEVAIPGEKFEGRVSNNRQWFLNEFIQLVRAMDLGFKGKRFTWENRQKGRAYIKERLDRFLVNREWLHMFEEARVDHLCSEALDHAPIILSTEEENNNSGRWPFRFLEAWTMDDSSREVVKSAWDQTAFGRCEAQKVQWKLSNTAKAFKIWNKSHFSFTHERIHKLETDLQCLSFSTGENKAEQLQIKEDLKKQRSRHESIFRQKSKELWLDKGDRNSKFFHSSIISRRRRNKVHAIFDNEAWVHNQADIQQYFLRNFKKVYYSKQPRCPESLGDLGFHSLTAGENDFLMHIQDEAEIKATINALHPLKAPGPDGFPGIFFRHYLETIKNQVTDCVQESFRVGELEKCLNKSFIVLVPKIQNATEFQHFRPISLCNFTYKIISKIIAQRLKIFLLRLISPNQGAFVKGRWIADNTILA